MRHKPYRSNRQQLRRLAEQAKETFGLDDVTPIASEREARERGLQWLGHVVYFVCRAGGQQIVIPLSKAVAYEPDEERENLRLMASVLVNASVDYVTRMGA